MNIAIVYNLVDTIQKGTLEDVESDNEIVNTVAAVDKALSTSGNTVVPIQISKDGNYAGFDVIFNLAEGIGGTPNSEPEVAKILEKKQLSFTGTSSRGLRLCCNKQQMKDLFKLQGIITPEYIVASDMPAKIDLKYPVILKPIHEHASVGLTFDSIVFNEESARKRLEYLLKVYKQPILIEEYIDGREVHVAMLGNGNDIEVLPFLEIEFDYPDNIPKLFSFEAKWVDTHFAYKGTRFICPASLDPKLQEMMAAVSRKAFRLINCRDYARMDFRIRDGVPYLLEVNANPSLNPNAEGIVKSALVNGYDYSTLINKILSICEKRCVQ